MTTTSTDRPSLASAAPATWKAFRDLHRETTTDGEVPRRLKEAAALAISVVKHCEGCIDHHARAAAKAGATTGEVAEMLGVALLMEGGPATVYGPVAWERFLDAVDEVARDRDGSSPANRDE